MKRKKKGVKEEVVGTQSSITIATLNLIFQTWHEPYKFSGL